MSQYRGKSRLSTGTKSQFLSSTTFHIATSFLWAGQVAEYGGPSTEKDGFEFERQRSQGDSDEIPARK